MKIILPPVQKKEQQKEGDIIKQLLRVQEFESTFEKGQDNDIPFYIIKHKGNDVLVLFDKFSASLKKKYKYVLKQASVPLKETNELIDTSGFVWIKHPLLQANFVARYSKDYVYKSWKE